MTANIFMAVKSFLIVAKNGCVQCYFWTIPGNNIEMNLAT